MVRLSFFCLLFLLCIANAVPLASATPIESGDCIRSTASVETDHADINAVVQQSPNRSGVIRITYNGLSEDDRLEVKLPSDVEIVHMDGFRQGSGPTTVAYSGGDPGVLEYKIGLPDEQTQYANGTNWVFAPAPSHIGDVGVNLQLDPNGVVGNEFIYIGNYTKYAVTDGCHKVAVVDSAAGDLPGDPEKIVHSLRFAATHLDVGHRYEDVTIFLTPGFAQPPDPGFARNSDAWVSKSSLVYGDLSYSRVVLHEYIHTRQAYNRGAIGGMSWVIEGSAEYLSYKYAHEVGAVSSEEYNSWLRNGSRTNAVLTDRTTWNSDYVPYGRGGAYLAILDHRIQTSSNASIESVIHQINAVGGDDSNVLVQRSLFLDTVENVSSDSVRDWANRSIDSADPFDTSQATVDNESRSVFDDLGERFEQRMSKKPYVGFFVAVLLGALLGMLPHELGRDKDRDPKDTERGEEEE